MTRRREWFWVSGRLPMTPTGMATVTAWREREAATAAAVAAEVAADPIWGTTGINIDPVLAAAQRARRARERGGREGKLRAREAEGRIHDSGDDV